MKNIGKDRDGITQVSLDALTSIKEQGYKLEMVRVYNRHREAGTLSAFFFGEDLRYVYEASGFAVGYGGEGPHGLWKAIRLWYPDKLDEDFWNTKIHILKSNKDWAWTPEKGWEIITLD